MGKQSRQQSRQARATAFERTPLGRAVRNLDVVKSRISESPYATFRYEGVDTVAGFKAKIAAQPEDQQLHFAPFEAHLAVLANRIQEDMLGKSSHLILNFFESTRRGLNEIKYAQKLLVAQTVTQKLTVVDTIADMRQTMLRSNEKARFNIMSLEDIFPDDDGLTRQVIYSYTGLVPAAEIPRIYLEEHHEPYDNPYDMSGSYERLVMSGNLAQAAVHPETIDDEYTADVESFMEKIAEIKSDKDFARAHHLYDATTEGVQQFTSEIAELFDVAARA